MIRLEKCTLMVICILWNVSVKKDHVRTQEWFYTNNTMYMYYYGCIKADQLDSFIKKSAFCLKTLYFMNK